MNKVISILNNLEREFNRYGMFSKRVRNKTKFYEKHHKGYYKLMTRIAARKIQKNFK